MRQALRPHRDAVAGGGRHEVATVPHDDGIDEVLVQVVHVLDDAVLERRADAHVVEDREMLHVLAQPHAAGVGQTGIPNFAASSSTASTSLTPPSRQLSIWQNRIAPACISCLNMTRLWHCSPVATPIGAIARAIAAWPSTSSGLVGSSIHQGSNRASSRMLAIASCTSHT